MSLEANFGTEDKEIARDRLLTVPTVFMTAPRPFLALHAHNMLVEGERFVTPWVGAMALTDGEGFVGRFIDKVLPRSRLGTSEFGVPADLTADSLALLAVGRGILKSPLAHPAAKLACSAVVASELAKTAWAAQANVRHYTEVGASYVKQPGIEGKKATVKKFETLALATLTHDLDPGWKRTACATASLAIAGSAAGDTVRVLHTYEDHLNEVLAS